MSVKRGVGVGVGVGVTFLYFLTSFFLSFSRNLHQLCIVTIFSDIKEIKEMKKNVLELLFCIIPNSRVIFQTSIEVANFFSTSTPIFAIEVHK